MSITARAVIAVGLLLPLSCAGPFEESNPGRGGAEWAQTSPPALPDAPYLFDVTSDQIVVLDAVPGEVPVAVSREQFTAAMRSLVPQLTRALAQPGRTGWLLRVDAEKAAPWQEELTRRYRRHCQELHGLGDCLRVLETRPFLDEDARYKLAFHFAVAKVWDGLAGELKDMVAPDRLEAALVSAVVGYLLLVLAPEPISKVVAAALTAGMVAYLGVTTFLEIVGGWKEMVEAVNRATTFDEVRLAGDECGKKVGAQLMRIVVMLMTAAISDYGLANLPKLPGYMAASARLAAATGGQGLGVVPQVGAAIRGEGRIVLVMAKAAKATQAAAAVATGGAGLRPVKCREENHHISTVENSKATWNGGPWTPRFKRLFAQVGLSMEDEANKVRVWGHVGPHPQEYHEFIFRRLTDVLSVCSTRAECRAAFIRQLRELANEIATPGTDLNELVTRGCEKGR